MFAASAKARCANVSDMTGGMPASRYVNSLLVKALFLV